MCEVKGHLHAIGHGACHCGCGPFHRHFSSSEENKKRLETYKEQLQKELLGVEECIQEFKDK